MGVHRAVTSHREGARGMMGSFSHQVGVCWTTACSLYKKGKDNCWLALHLYRLLPVTEQDKPILVEVTVRNEVVVTKNDWKILKVD